eukprot:5997186-Amphidinium_carterae.1
MAEYACCHHRIHQRQPLYTYRNCIDRNDATSSSLQHIYFTSTTYDSTRPTTSSPPRSSVSTTFTSISSTRAMNSPTSLHAHLRRLPQQHLLQSVAAHAVR